MTETEIAISQASLFAKMSRVMGKMNRLKKRGHNDYFNFDFATSEDVSDLVRQAMAEEGLALFVNILETKRLEKLTQARFMFVFADGETGATYSCQWESEAIDAQDKGISKAVTSAIKYFLLKTFLISTGDEPDPDSDDKAQKPKKREYSSTSTTAQVPAAPVGAAVPPLGEVKTPATAANGDAEYTRKDAIYQAVVDAGLSENIHSAKKTLTSYCKTGYATPEAAIAWMRLYRGWRDLGGDPKQAAESANNGEVPK